MRKNREEKKLVYYCRRERSASDVYICATDATKEVQQDQN
jgi:hypothetical protein